MKIALINNRFARGMAAGLALSVCILTAVVLLRPATADDKKASSSFTEEVKRWQEKMSEKFRDTWKDWRGKGSERSVGAASIDLREQNDSFTVRLNLPDRTLEKVEIKLDGNWLSIVAPPENKLSRYEQRIALTGAKPEAELKIERRQTDKLIVVTVPKTPDGVSAQASPPRKPSLGLLDDWDQDVFTRMENMRREMDRIFEDSFRDFRSGADFKGFFDRPGFGSSLDLQDEGDKYVVRIYLPNRDMENVNVTVEGETLKVEAKAESEEKKNDQSVIRSQRAMANYSQVITLPGPVKADKMNMEKKDGMIVVTLPKA